MNKNNFLNYLKNSKYLEMLPSFKEEKTKTYMTIVLSLIAVSFFGLLAINPTLSTISQLQRELEDNKFVNQKLEEKISNLSKLQQKYSLLESDLPIVLMAIPQSPKAPLLIGQIQALGLKTNTEIKKISVSQVELSLQRVTQSPSFTFSVEVQGSYKELMEFFKELVNFERIVTVDFVSLSKSPEKDTLQLNLRGRAYFKG